MCAYDFHAIEPMEFQNLLRDIVQVRDSLFFESFKAGRDGGVDGLLQDSAGKTVLQSKRYRDFGQLYYHLKTSELERVRRQQPDRYILGVACDLSSGEKEKILELFQGFILDRSDLLSAQDLNNLLAQPPYSHIVKNYVKLWLPGVTALECFMENAVNRPKLQESVYFLKDALKASKTFVQTEIYNQAASQLEKNGVVILSGDPGMGKTTMANLLALSFLQEDAGSGFCWIHSIDDVYGLLRDDGSRQAFILDDFWGSIYVENGRSGDGRRLESLIGQLCQMENKRLILTTREYIFQQELWSFPELETIAEALKLECILQKYTESEKARILFAHLKNSGLEIDYVLEIYYRCGDIISHPCYNPRIIDLYLKKYRPEEGMDPVDYAMALEEFLQYPDQFWTGIFKGLSLESRMLAMIVLTLQAPVRMEDAKLCYCRYLMNASSETLCRNFMDCIAELEHSIVMSYLQADTEELMLAFQNPSIEDYLKQYIYKNKEMSLPGLFSACAFYEQTLFLLEHCISGPGDELLFFGEQACISGFYELPCRLQDYKAPECGELWDSDRDALCGRMYHMVRIGKAHDSRAIFEFARQFLENLDLRTIRESFCGRYFELLEYTRLICKCVEVGIPMDGQWVMENYLNCAFSVDHLMEFPELEKAFPEGYKLLEEFYLSLMRNNAKQLILDSLQDFQNERMLIETDMLVDRIPEILETYGLEDTLEFAGQVEAITGRSYDLYKLETTEAGPWEPQRDETICQDLDSIMEEGYRWLFGETASYPNLEAFMELIAASGLEEQGKSFLIQAISGHEPWYIKVFVKTQEDMLLLIEAVKMGNLEPGCTCEAFLMTLLAQLSEDKELISRFFCCCIDLSVYMLGAAEGYFSVEGFQKSDLYRNLLKEDSALEALVFQYVLDRREEWVVIKNEFWPLFGLAYQQRTAAGSEYGELFFGGSGSYLVTMQTDRARNNSRERVYLTSQYEYYSYQNHRWKALLMRLSAELNEESFCCSCLYPHIKEYLEGFVTLSDADAVGKLLFSLLCLSVEKEGPQVWIMADESMDALDILGEIDLAPLLEFSFTEDQKKLLFQCEGRNDRVYFCGDESMPILKALGIYDQALALASQLRSVYQRAKSKEVSL